MRYLLLCLLAFSFSAVAQPTEPGAQAAAMGGAFVTQVSPLALRHNVAASAMLQSNQLVAGARNNYFVPGLNDFYAMLTLKSGLGAFGVDFQYYGFDAFQQGNIGISYSRAISKNWFAGARISYAYNYIPQEEVNRQLVAADVGVVGKIGSWRIGASLQNFIQSKWLGSIAEREPLVFRVGGSYHFNAQTCLAAELYKANNQKADVRLGLAYAPAKQLVIRAGFSTLRPSIGFGLDIVLNQFQINLAANWHQQLGLSPLTEVGYAW